MASYNNYNSNIMHVGKDTNVVKKFFKEIWEFVKEDILPPVLGVFVLGIIVCIGILATTSDKGDYEMTYKVYYSDNNVKEYTIKHYYPIISTSENGANIIRKKHGETVISTTATIEVVKYENHARKNKNK